MAVKSRPGFSVNVERTTKSTERKSVFLDLKAGQALNLRFLPSWTPEGDLFFVSAQHYKFTENGEKRAWACLDVHGEGDCPICQMVEAARTKVNDGDDRFEKYIDRHNQSLRWHAQVVPIREGQTIEQSYVFGFSKTTADKVSGILKMERDTRQPLLTDPDKGQTVYVSRNDKSGKATRYEVQATGVRVGLDEIFPEWTESFLDVEKAIGLRIGNRDQLLASIKETIGTPMFETLLGNDPTAPIV